MKFRTIPPDPAELPRFKLLWPAVPPALLLGWVWVGELIGHTWNIHGDGALLILLFFGSLLVGSIATIFTLFNVVPALRQHPTLRTRTNLACTGVAVAFLFAAALLILGSVVKLVGS